MSLRIPTSYGNRQTLLDIQRSKERYASLQLELATGKRINTPTDDPTASALIVDLNASVGQNTQYLRQIESARSLATASETVLQSVQGSLVRLMELGTQGLGGGTAGAAAVAEQVDALRTSILDLANTESQGKYLFAGTMTTTKPFADVAGTITYSGDSGISVLNISKSAQVNLNLPGDQVFMGAGGGLNIMQTITDLRDGLRTGNTTLAQTALNNLKTAQSQILTNITKLGGVQTSLDQIQDNLENFNLSLKSVQGSYEDVDYPTAMTEFNAEDIAQKAALNALARSSRQNLFDYMG